MKKFRSIAVMLILVLASSPALAAICAASCASQSATPLSLYATNIDEMQHCHEDSASTDETHTSNTEHKSCVMGAVCHFAQVISDVDPLSKYAYVDTASVLFATLASSDKSVNSPPPVKPPA